MRKLLIITFLFCAHIMWAQNSIKYFSDFTNLEKIIDLSNYGFKPDFTNLTYNSCSNGIVFSNYDASLGVDSIQIMNLNPTDMKIKRNILYIKGLSKYLLNNRYQTIQYIAKNENWTIIGVYQQFYIFDNRNQLHIIVKHRMDYSDVKFLSKNELIFFTNKNRKKHNSIISKYSIANGLFVKEIYPNFTMIEYTHISGNHWFDVNDGLVLFSQTLSYDINIYNQNLELSDSIRLIGKGWKELSLDKQQEISSSKLTGIDAIRAILPYEKDISRMEQVFFFNDSLIITYYNVPDGQSNYIEREHNFDIWQKIDDKWSCKYFGYQDLYRNGIISNSNYPLFIGKLSRDIAFSEGFLFAFMPFAPLLPSGKEKKEYLQKCDDYLINNSPKPLIYVYSVKFKK